jgi:hypothetical protein
MITQNKLKKIIHYDPETGVFTWLRSKKKAIAGRQAGYLARLSSRSECRYRIICIAGTNYLAHRLAFLYMSGSFPQHHVDHLNHDGSDNKWANLRDVSSTENNRNIRKHHDNKSGICGVWFDKNRWIVKIGINSKQICVGRFDNLFDAVCARKIAEVRHGYHINHGAA